MREKKMVSERKIDRRVKQAKELTKDDVEEIKEKIDKIDERLYDIQQNMPR